LRQGDASQKVVGNMEITRLMLKPALGDIEVGFQKLETEVLGRQDSEAVSLSGSIKKKLHQLQMLRVALIYNQNERSRPDTLYIQDLNRSVKRLKLDLKVMRIRIKRYFMLIRFRMELEQRGIHAPTFAA